MSVEASPASRSLRPSCGTSLDRRTLPNVECRTSSRRDRDTPSPRAPVVPLGPLAAGTEEGLVDAGGGD